MYEHLDRRYALALYNTCTKAKNLEIVLEQFEEIVNEFSNNKQVQKLLKNPQITKATKKKIFKEMFKDSIEEELLNFLLVLIEKGRILYLKEKFDQLREIYFEHKNTVIAKVTSAIPLTEYEKTRLKENLEKRYEKTVIIEEKIDTSIIGVAKVLIGDEAIDGSIKAKLNEVKALCHDIDNEGYEEFKRKYLNRDNNSILREKEIELIAEVTTSIPLTEDQKIRLTASLKKFYDRNIVIKEIVDESILGGVLVKVGNDVIDGTIKDKPQHIKRDMFMQ